MLQIIIVGTLLGQLLAASSRPTMAYFGKSYGIFDPTHSVYLGDNEGIDESLVNETLNYLRVLLKSASERSMADKADPSFRGMFAPNLYQTLPSLKKRYVLERLMSTQLKFQYPIVMKYLVDRRQRIQNSALARGKRNLFRASVGLVAEMMNKIWTTSFEPKPYTIATLSGGGDAITAAYSLVKDKVLLPELRLILMDPDKDLSRLSRDIAQYYYRLPVSIHQEMRLTDVENLEKVKHFIQHENIRWIHSIDALMFRPLKKSNGQLQSRKEREQLFQTYCEAGVEHLTFNTVVEHALPRFLYEVGWQDYEMDWSPAAVESLLNNAGYRLVRMDYEAAPHMRLYHFEWACP